MANKEGVVRGVINFADVAGSAGLGNHYLEEWSKGIRFIDIFLQRVREMRTLDHVVAFVHPANHEALKEVLDFYSIQIIEIPGLAPYAQNQERVISSRKWSYQNWTGCPSSLSIFDEIVAMGMVGYFAELTNPSKLVYLTPETPFFNPQAADLMVESSGKNFEDMQFDVLCQPLPMGISAFVISKERLKELSSKSVWMPGQILMAPEVKVPIKMRSAMGFPKLDNERRSFLLRSQRDLRRLQAWSGKFEEMADLEEYPKEIQLEVTSTPHHARCRLPELQPSEEMTIEAVQSLLEDVTQIDDMLVSIGDLGSLWHYSKREELRQLLLAHRPYGVHVVFDARDVFDNLELFDVWVESQFDIITIRLTSLGDTAEELAVHEETISQLVKKHITQTSRTILNFELHKFHDNWKMIDTLQKWVDQHRISFNWVGYNDYAGQLDHEVKLPVYSPRKRGPCQKVLNQMHILPNGDVTACRQDFSAKTILGNVEKNNIMEIWSNEVSSQIRSVTKNNCTQATELCVGCRQSFFV